MVIAYRGSSCLPARAVTTIVRAIASNVQHHRLRRGDDDKRHNGSVKVTAGPTIPWREIKTRGDMTRI
ncbi:hypothetical protein B296_00014230 [Ensete ventricosum]|uniref:Uncharacterized protein n=1 Tax=Ensete ventricosum TaxID=4639 RepID=A0A426YUM5_ENSVE|nr:hypothetical protein B296_00014230 [Ensete ventricosum]